MRTTIDTTGKATTEITKSDRKVLEKALAMALHIQANVLAIQGNGDDAGSALLSILKHFDEAKG